MTIYVAICDDNVAQRKQTERLLGREKDSRLKTSGDVLYIDSFGSSEALMRTPIKYDIFFIDVTNENQNGMEIAKLLRDHGIIAPIIMCSSTINYLESSIQLTNLTHVAMPISQNTVSLMIDNALSWSQTKPPLIEIRCQESTTYVRPEDIVIAHFVRPLLTNVTLTNGSTLEMTDSIQNFYKMCKFYSSYIYLGKTVVNPIHITNIKGNKMLLSNGSSEFFNIFKLGVIKEKYPPRS